jgi:ABC-type dipeptide/oligopeptide/nickel transport system ATPase subunit
MSLDEKLPARHPLLEVRGLCKTHKQGRWWQHQFQIPALDNVDLTLSGGRTLALVGESGAGKTTLAMCLLGLEKPDAGEIFFDGRNSRELRGKERVSVYRRIQLIFQDSAGALNPRMSAAEILEEPLLIAGEERALRRERALKAMDQVGLPSTWSNRRPHELSGGQRQRLAIARALVPEPKLVILDEALAGLDLSIQAQISNLLLDLQGEQKLSYLCISHDLAQVARFADEVAIMRQGKVTKHDGMQPIAETPSAGEQSRSATMPGAECTFGAGAGGQAPR